MRRFCLVFCLVFLLTSVASMAASDAEIRTAIEKSLKQGQSAGSFTTIVGVYGGKGVLSTAEGAWWIKDGKIFAVNGVAAELSPEAPRAPPSVSVQTLQAAVAGEVFDLPPNLGFTCEELVAGVTDNVQELNAKNNLNCSLKKESFDHYSLSTGQDAAAQFAFKEVGGLVSAIALNGYSLDDPKEAKTLAANLLAASLIYTVVPDIKSARQLTGRLLNNKKGRFITPGNLAVTFKREKGMLDVSITPTADQSTPLDAAQKEDPAFSLSSQNIVENFNKAAKAGKSSQRARIETIHEGITQVVISRKTGMILTANDDGKVNAVMHIGMGAEKLDAGSDIMLGMGFAIGSIKPDWSSLQCAEVLKKLGLGSGQSPKASSVVVDGVLFEFKMSDFSGWLTITPQPQE